MNASKVLALPTFSPRFAPVWRRNLLVWRKLAIASVLGNIADPLLYMLALGYGIGSLVGNVSGMSYIEFIGTGMVCQSAMFTASFEGMYSAFSRMHVQRTWEGIINAPIALDDVVMAEWLWAASKSVISTAAILVVIVVLGYGHTWLALGVLPVGLLVGLTFGAAGLVMNALAPNYDFFTYFFTLVLTPMLLLSGVYFPVEQMPPWLATITQFLPLKHAIDLARPLMLGRIPEHIVLHVAVLLFYSAVAYYAALVLTRRRLLKMMLAIKSLHIIFMVAWFAGLFYLPRLFVYHTLATDAISIERFKVMERRLYSGIMTPSAVLTLVFGLWLWLGYGITGGWMHAKLALVAILVAHHLWLGKLARDFAADRNTHSDRFYRWINEIPALPILVLVVFLVVMKPF